MCPQNPTDREVRITAQGRFKDELAVIKYVKNMLEDAGLFGDYHLQIVKKIHGGPEHHGIQVQHIEHSALRMKVQTGDNGTRFLCRLRSSQIHTMGISIRLESVLTMGKYVVGKKQRSTTPQQQVRATETPAPLSMDNAKPDEPSLTGHLIEYANDDTLRNYILTTLHGLYKDGSFSPKDLNDVMVKENVKASAHGIGQLARRLTDRKYFEKVPVAGARRYKLTESAIACVLKGSGQIPVPMPAMPSEMGDAERQIASLRRLVNERMSAVESAEALEAELDSCRLEIDDLRMKVAGLERKKEELVRQLAVRRQVVESKTHVEAEKKLTAISSILSG